MRTPLLTDGMRHRIDSRATAFHSRTLELLRDMPGNRCGVEVRQFSDTVVATAATSTPETQWMQHVSGLIPGDQHLVPKIGGAAPEKR